MPLFLVYWHEVGEFRDHTSIAEGVDEAEARKKFQAILSTIVIDKCEALPDKHYRTVSHAFLPPLLGEYY